MEKILELIKKFCTKEVIFYAIFGLLTTFVNVGVFYLFTKFVHLEENLANIIAIILAILFAYFTNKKLVFHSKACGLKENFNEFVKFILGRSFTMIIELVGFFVMFNILHIQELISKLTITILVIVLNFFISKFFAFKK